MTATPTLAIEAAAGPDLISTQGYVIEGIAIPWDQSDIYDIGLGHHRIHQELFLILLNQNQSPFTVALHLRQAKIITVPWSGILSLASDRALIEFYDWQRTETTFNALLQLFQSISYTTSDSWMEQVYDQISTSGERFRPVPVTKPIPKLIGQIIIQDRKAIVPLHDPPIPLSAELILTRQADLERLQQIGRGLGLFDLGQDEDQWIDLISQTPIAMGSDNSLRLEIGKLIRNEYPLEQMLQFYNVIYWDGPPAGNLQDFILSETLILL